jgi:hypothetical protein
MVSTLPWLSGQNIYLCLLISKGKSRIDISAHTNDQHKNTGEWERNLKQDKSDKRPNLSHVGGKQVNNSLFKIVKNLSSLLNSIDNG